MADYGANVLQHIDLSTKTVIQTICSREEGSIDGNFTQCQMEKPTALALITDNSVLLIATANGIRESRGEPYKLLNSSPDWLNHNANFQGHVIIIIRPIKICTQIATYIPFVHCQETNTSILHGEWNIPISLNTKQSVYVYKFLMLVYQVSVCMEVVLRVD